MARKPRSKTIGSRLTAVERGIGSLRASDKAIIDELRDGFARVESRLAGVYCGSAPYFTPIHQKSFDLMDIEE